MKNRSPLLVSALELVAHAIDLYVQANQRKYKFIVLHLANAVELMLKDRVLLTGVSKQLEKDNQNVGEPNVVSPAAPAPGLRTRPVVKLLFGIVLVVGVIAVYF